MTKAFISYSWDDEDHKNWVYDLAARLRHDGIDVTLDQWDLVPGDQLPHFMERAVRESNFVLIVCTPGYKSRSDQRQGGVGWEGDMMTAEVMNTGNDRKFIPLLRKSTWKESAPTWMEGKIYIDFSRLQDFEKSYCYLLDILLGRRKNPPPLGSMKFLEQVTAESSVTSTVRTSIKSIKHPYFVGRNKELMEFRSVWEDVKSNKELRFILVEGIPGSGKTALVEMFLKEMVTGSSSFFEVKCIKKDTEKSLVPFEAIFSQRNRSRSEFGVRGADVQLSAKFQQFTDFLKKKAKRNNGLILFLDDIQWMDETSMNLLQTMKEVLFDCPLLIILAYRSTEIKRRTPMDKLLKDIKHTVDPCVVETHEGIRVKDYADQKYAPNRFDPGFIKTMQEKTKGNPFIVQTFLDHLKRKGIIYLAEEKGYWVLKDNKVIIPNDAWELIEEQVRDINPDHLDLIKTASTEGEIFTFELLCIVKNLSPDQVAKALDEFVDLEILHEPQGYEHPHRRDVLPYQFTHSLYREYFYHVQHAAERVKNHQDLAAAIQTFYAQNLEEVAYQLAQHYEQSNHWEQAFDFSLIAGKVAKSNFYRQKEKEWAGKCLEFLKQRLDENSIDIGKRCQVAIMWADGPTQNPRELKSNEKLLKRHISLLVDDAWKKLKCEALISLAYVQYEIGSLEAAGTAQVASQLAGELNDLALKYEAVSILSDIWLDNEENFEESEKTNLEAIRIAEELNDSYRLAGTLASYAWLLTDLGKPDEACKSAEQAIHFVEEEDFPDDDNLKAYIYRMAATAYEAKRDFIRALLYYRKCLSLYRQLGAKVKICWVYYDLGDCLAQAYRHPAAIHFFNRCIQEAKKIGNLDTHLWSLVSWADIDLLENRTEMAAKRLEEAQKIIEDPERRAIDQDILEFQTSLSMLKFQQGDYESAEQLAYAVIEKAKYPVDRFFSILNLGKYLLKTGAEQEALAQLKKSAQIAFDLNDPLWRALAHEQIGDYYRSKSAYFEAIHHYEHSLHLVSGIYYYSGANEIRSKMEATRKYVQETLMQISENISLLSRTFVALKSQISVSYVNPHIFLKKYFVHCLECGFCHDSCCSFGADIDIVNMETLKNLKAEIAPFLRETEQEWFDPQLKYDAEFPGNLYSRTTVLGNRCIFISKDQRGCGLQRYAIAKGKDTHAIKPIVCALFPVTFEQGVLTLSTELEDGSLECSGNGYSAYQGVRKELEYYFGTELVQELDTIEKRTLSQAI